jgi:hypothetical protein
LNVQDLDPFVHLSSSATEHISIDAESNASWVFPVFVVSLIIQFTHRLATKKQKKNLLITPLEQTEAYTRNSDLVSSNRSGNVRDLTRAFDIASNPLELSNRYLNFGKIVELQKVCY